MSLAGINESVARFAIYVATTSSVPSIRLGESRSEILSLETLSVTPGYLSNSKTVWRLIPPRPSRARRELSFISHLPAPVCSRWRRRISVTNVAINRGDIIFVFEEILKYIIFLSMIDYYSGHILWEIISGVVYYCQYFVEYWISHIKTIYAEKWIDAKYKIKEILSKENFYECISPMK